MEEQQVVALVAALLDTLEQGKDRKRLNGKARPWRSTGHPHVDGWAWHPHGPDAYRLSGRLCQMLGKKPGRK
jgi:hypothetical protein